MYAKIARISFGFNIKKLQLSNINDISQELLETIERYLNDTMGQEERSSFEEKLQSNTELNQQVQDIEIMLFGIETSALKEKLDIFHKDLITDISSNRGKPKGKGFPFIKYAIAASVALLISIGGWWITNQKSSNEKLFAKHFRPDPGLATTMSINNNYEFYNAMVSYKHEDYSIAIKKWERILHKKPENDTLNYFLGVAYLANGNEITSIKHLNFVTKIKNSAFEKDAFYYLGLAHLKNGNEYEARRNLSKSEIDKSKLIIRELKD